MMGNLCQPQRRRLRDDVVWDYYFLSTSAAPDEEPLSMLFS
jgi:hypothetical protein